MQILSSATAVEVLSRDVPPAARCQSGDRVAFDTRDCYDNRVTSPLRPLGDRPDGLENPVTGPLYVEGAEVGDVLKVEIERIELRDWGVMRSSVSSGAFRGMFDHREAKIFDLTERRIAFDDKLRFEEDTMIGVIGTAPAGEGIPATTPGAHGGNMDCKKIVAGSTLYLPVNAPGALLFMGDLHARMGDGEVFICGLETAGRVTVRVTVLKQADPRVPTLPTPFLLCRGQVMSIQSAKTMEEAGDLAIHRLHAFVKAATGCDDLHAGMLLSLLSDLAVCQIVDPLYTMRAEFPVDALAAYGYDLP